MRTRRLATGNSRSTFCRRTARPARFDLAIVRERSLSEPWRRLSIDPPSPMNNEERTTMVDPAPSAAAYRQEAQSKRRMVEQLTDSEQILRLLKDAEALDDL